MAARTDVSKDVEAKGGMAIEAAMFLGITAFFVLAGIIYAIEAQNPARSAALGPEAYARLALETTTRYLAAHGLKEMS